MSENTNTVLPPLKTTAKSTSTTILWKQVSCCLPVCKPYRFSWSTTFIDDDHHQFYYALTAATLFALFVLHIVSQLNRNILIQVYAF